MQASPKGKSRIGDRASKATEALERMWRELIMLEPELPPVVMVILSGGSRGSQWGHYARWSWRYRGKRRIDELAVSPNLFGSPEDLLAVVLHEAAHAILRNHDSGCSQGGVYHLKGSFAHTCEALGLKCVYGGNRHGWNQTGWPKGKKIPERYKKILADLRQSLPWGTAGAGARGRVNVIERDQPKSCRARLVCKCKDQHRCIYVNKSVARDGGLFCLLCGNCFEEGR